MGENASSAPPAPPLTPPPVLYFCSLIHLPISLNCHLIAGELPDSFLTSSTIYLFQSCHYNCVCVVKVDLIIQLMGDAVTFSFEYFREISISCIFMSFFLVTPKIFWCLLFWIDSLDWEIKDVAMLKKTSIFENTTSLYFLSLKRHLNLRTLLFILQFRTSGKWKNNTAKTECHIFLTVLYVSFQHYQVWGEKCSEAVCAAVHHWITRLTLGGPQRAKSLRARSRSTSMLCTPAVS